MAARGEFHGERQTGRAGAYHTHIGFDQRLGLGMSNASTCAAKNGKCIALATWTSLDFEDTMQVNTIRAGNGHRLPEVKAGAHIASNVTPTSLCFGGGDMRDGWICCSGTGELVKTRWR
jgi:hypothetical protein